MFLFQVTHWYLYREEDLWNPQQQQFQVKKLALSRKIIIERFT